VDSTTIQLVARCLDWAKHRRRKAAAKCHVRLNLQTFLPQFALVDTAGEHDNLRAREMCAGVQAGEIVIFDKAYVDFAHLADLAMREVFWVTRAKDNLQGRVVRKLQAGPDGNILRDDLVALTGPTEKFYPVELRRVTALVEVDGELREMIFLTNNVSWTAQTVADLYRCRWSIEVFFKELKQTLQLADFLGHNANAVKWQVWTAIFCCASGPASANGATASPGSLPWSVRPCGKNWPGPACSNAMGQPAAAAAFSARHNKPICRVTDNPMGQPSFIDSKKHQILKPIFRRPRIFTGKSARFTHAAFTSGTHLFYFHVCFFTCDVVHLHTSRGRTIAIGEVVS